MKRSSLGLLFVLAFGARAARAGDNHLRNAETPASTRFKISGWVEAGVTFNSEAPGTRQNFGHLFTDRANEPLLNQLVFTAERSLDTAPDASGFDWGFKAQVMYGGDARYIHSTGLLQNTQHEIVQPDVVEAWLLLHAPIAGTAGGFDLKVGKFVTLEGAETIDPRTTVFYSHSYIFNFGIPFNHTGALGVSHLARWLDVYTGVTRGVNVGTTDNNGSVSFHGGCGLNFYEGSLTALATTHIGPENPHNNHDQRCLNDLVVTWKVNANTIAVLDANFAQDDSPARNAKAYGAAAYLTYQLRTWCTLALREELFRDEKGFFVGSFADHDDYIDLERGKLQNIDPRTFFRAGTVNAVTVGATLKMPTQRDHLGGAIRPELRWDHSSARVDQLTASIDAIITF